MEAAGKAAFLDDFAKEGLRQWLGVPHSISPNDGRIMGGYLEMFLQSMHLHYEVEAFNDTECIYILDLKELNFGAQGSTKLADAYKWFWYGMTKSLVSAEWSLWEEDSPEGKLRLKIAKKIDKFC